MPLSRLAAVVAMTTALLAPAAPASADGPLCVDVQQEQVCIELSRSD